MLLCGGCFSSTGLGWTPCNRKTLHRTIAASEVLDYIAEMKVSFFKYSAFEVTVNLLDYSVLTPVLPVHIPQHRVDVYTTSLQPCVYLKRLPL